MGKLLKQLAIFAAPALIALGIFKFTLYYFFFNVPITKFLELSEVIVLFANDIILYIVVVCLTTLFSFWTFRTHKSVRYKRDLLKIFAGKSIDERFLKLLWLYPSWIIALIAFGGASIFLYYTGDRIYNTQVALLIETIILLIVKFSIIETKRKLRQLKQLKKENVNYETIFSFFIGLLNIVAIYTCIEVQRVKYEYKYINTSLIIDSTTFNSDSTHFYIGNTSRYYFLYDNKLNKATVIPVERIKQISFGEIYYIPKGKAK